MTDEAGAGEVEATAFAAYGGPGWRPREASSLQEMGTIWAPYTVRSEFAPLRTVLLHRPGEELADVVDPDAALMLARIDTARAAAQHDALAAAYARERIDVLRVEPAQKPPPNQLYVADLLFMTPAGAILARPAAQARAGEERWLAARAAALGVPILRSVAGRGTFEGADAMWLDEQTVLIGRGLRTNAEGAAQVADALHDIGVDALVSDLPYGTMHLMGQLRIVDRNLALVSSGRIAWAAVEALRAAGYEVHAFPDEREMATGFAHNFVTLAPRRIVMPAGNPRSAAFYAKLGIECVEVEVDELHKAAGGIGCMTGVLSRDDA
jgi:arginine deiminase